MITKGIAAVVVVLGLLFGLYVLTLPDAPETEQLSLQQRAEQGHADAQSRLGLIYAAGQGVPQDDTEAVRWFRLAAEQGSGNAQNNLGVSYSFERGVPQDYVEAHKWRNLAASRLTGDDRERAAEARDALAVLMTPAQLAKAQKLAREWQAAFDARQE